MGKTDLNDDDFLDFPDDEGDGPHGGNGVDLESLTYPLHPDDPAFFFDADDFQAVEEGAPEERRKKEAVSRASDLVLRTVRTSIPQIVALESLTPISAKTLMTLDLPEQEPIASGILNPEAILVIGGLVKSRKTWLAIQLALSLASGTDFLNHGITGKYKVLYIGGEGSDRTIRKRLLLAAANFPGLEDDDLDYLGIISSLGRVKLDTTAGEAWLQRVSEGYDVIIVDPYYRFLSVGSENVHEDQRVIQDVFDRLKSTGKAIVIAHHLRKSTGIDAGAGELRGAGMDAFADSIMILSKRKSPSGDRFTVRYTLRHDEEPRDLELSPMGPLLQMADEDSMVGNDEVVRVIRELGGRVDGRKPIEDELMVLTAAGRQTCINAINRAENSGRIYSAKRTGVGRGKTFIIPTDADSFRADGKTL